MKQGPVSPWNRWPQIYPGPTGPLSQNQWAAIETPDIQHLAIGHNTTFRDWGWPIGFLPPSLVGRPLFDSVPTDPDWGVGSDSAVLDSVERLQMPTMPSERVAMLDVQRCVDVPAASITAAGFAVELAHLWVGADAIGVIERLQTIMEVQALDGAGDPAFTYSGLNGERPCRDALVHPDPLVDPLTWSFRAVVQRQSFGDRRAPYLTGPPQLIAGDSLVPPWSDLRNGFANRASDGTQWLLAPLSLVRVWIVLVGPSSRYAVTVGARLGGYTQLAGRRGVAVRAAVSRFDR